MGGAATVAPSRVASEAVCGFPSQCGHAPTEVSRDATLVRQILMTHALRSEHRRESALARSSLYIPLIQRNSAKAYKQPTGGGKVRVVVAFTVVVDLPATGT